MNPLAILVGGAFFGDILLPLVAAALLGGAVGLERELHGRAAGLRTHIMVCMGSTMVMLISMQMDHLIQPSAASAWRIDPGRIAAGIVTGIGFIGAGAIMKLKSTNRGLTTAACIWFVAALGIVIGVGDYALALAATLLSLVVLMLLARVEGHLRPDAYREIILVAARSDDLLGQARAAIAELGMTVQVSEFEEELDKDQIRAVFNVRFRGPDVGEQALRRLGQLPGVKTIGWRSVVR